jgi:ribosome-binding factor A
MADQARAKKLAKRIAVIVATAIEHEVKDPRLQFVTITDAKVTADLQNATVYYTVRAERLDGEADHTGAAEALEKAKGALRSRVGAGTGVRFTPTLAFVLDSIPDTAKQMEELLAKARAADAEVARVRANATPAGDADPYRIPLLVTGEDNAEGPGEAADAPSEGPGGDHAPNGQQSH